MPKRIGHLYETCISLDSLHAAYLTARRGKRRRLAVANFERDLGANLAQLHRELVSGKYQPQPCKEFWITDPKPRLIAAPAFRDVVVQHAIYRLIYPIYDSTFIHDSYGCRLGKGTHRAADQAQRFLRKYPDHAFILQLDIKKFYYSIDRDVLSALLARKIKDRQLLALMMKFAQQDSPRGIPIGSLLSQLYALIYLNPLDHFIKRDLKAKHYVRYVDDFFVICNSKDQCRQVKNQIEKFLFDKLKLEFSRSSIHSIKKGIDFVGFRTWRSTRVIRKRSLYNFSKALKHSHVASITSIMAHAKRTATFKFFCRKIANEYLTLAPNLPLFMRP